MPMIPMQEGRAPEAAGIPPWIFALAGLFLLMVGANSVMVWKSASGHRDLVRADYYTEGLKEDQAIARHALSLAAGRVTLERVPAGWRVGTESDVPRSGICRAHFYRPDDGREDRVVILSRIASDRGGLWEGPGAGLRRGAWVVKLVWEENGAPISETSMRYQAP